MATVTKCRLGLSTLLLIVLCTGFLIGSVRIAGLFYGILASAVLHFLLYLGSKSRIWRISAICQIALFTALSVLAIMDALFVGPYTRYFNHSMHNKAMEEGLIGANEEQVEEVLGKASYCYSGWTSTYIDSGKPTPNSRLVTTYNFSPFIPMAQFQVHCEDGKVISLEMFDD